MLSSGHGVSQDPAGPQDPREDSHRRDGAGTREIFTESCKPWDGPEAPGAYRCAQGTARTRAEPRATRLADGVPATPMSPEPETRVNSEDSCARDMLSFSQEEATDAPPPGTHGLPGPERPQQGQ